MRWYYGDMGPGWLGVLFMIITMVVFWGGLVTVGIVLVRQFRRGGGPRRESPTEILAARFARGEIDEEEYHKGRDALSH